MFLLNSGVGKDWAGPFFPPPPPLGSNLSIYLSVLGLNYSYNESEHSWWAYLKEKFKLQAFSQMILLNRGWGKTGPAHSFPPLLFSNLSIYLSVLRFNQLLHCIWTLMIVFWFMLLFDCIWTILNDLFQREIKFLNQQVNWYFYIVGWGKTGLAHSSPSKMLGSFFLSSRLLEYVILLLFQNSLDLYQAENQVFKPTSLFVIVGWGKTGPAHSFPLLNLLIFLWLFSLSHLCYSFTVS